MLLQTFAGKERKRGFEKQNTYIYIKMKKEVLKSTFLMAMTLSSALQANADDVTFTSSNLPIVIIQTDQAINAETKVRGTMKIICNGEGEINHISDAANDYDGYIGIKWRGESSLNFNQKKYTIETRDALDNDTAVSLLGMPEEADWVLLAPYNDVSMVRDVFAYQMWNQMGHWGPRTQMCEVVVNGDYRGVYALCESIKRDKNRVDISKLKPEDIEGRDVTGGYIVRIDAFDEEDVTFQSKVMGIQQQQWGWGGQQNVEAPITWTIYYPKKKDLQPEQFIDVTSFVDYFIHTEVSLNADGFKRSAYYYKEKDKKDGTRGKLFAGPVWDFNLAYGNCNFCKANNVNAWVYQGCETNPTPVMWRRLLEDEAFRNAVKCRYLELRQTILSEEAIDQFLDSYAALLDEAKDRQLTKYKEILKSSNPWDWGGTNFFAAYRVSSYAEEISIVKNWFRQRLQFLDKNLPGECDGETSMQNLSFFDVGFNFDGQVATIESPQPITRIDVINAAGTCLQSENVPKKCKTVVDLTRQGHGMFIIVCYTADGCMVSRSIMK